MPPAELKRKLRPLYGFWTFSLLGEASSSTEVESSLGGLPHSQGTTYCSTPAASGQPGAGGGDPGIEPFLTLI